MTWFNCNKGSKSYCWFHMVNTVVDWNNKIISVPTVNLSSILSFTSRGTSHWWIRKCTPELWNKYERKVKNTCKKWNAAVEFSQNIQVGQLLMEQQLCRQICFNFKFLMYLEFKKYIWKLLLPKSVLLSQNFYNVILKCAILEPWFWYERLEYWESHKNV